MIALVLVFAAFPVIASNAETRSLKLHFLHTGEKDTITFKKNGKYVKGGLKKINHFLRDWRRNEPTKMNPRLLDLIWEVYKETGSKNYIKVISAYRSPATNSLLRKRGRGVARTSQHTLGNALDFFIPGVSLRKLRNIGLRKGIGGVGYYPKSGSPFVHMDTGRVRHWPRMSRKELVKVFPRGKTLHVPTDGKPLPGYNIAKANYERAIKGQGKITIASAEEIEKKPSLLAKLFSRDEDEESNVSSAAAPKPVRPTAVQPAPAQTPETVIASLQPNQIPVPVVAPRITIVKPPEPAIEETQVASLPAENTVENPVDNPLDNPVEETAQNAETELAINVGVPLKRPAYIQPPLAVVAESAPAPRPSVEIAALSPNEISDLRQQVYAALESDTTAPAQAATQTATNIPFQPPTNVDKQIPFQPPTNIDDRIPFQPPTQLEESDVPSLIASASSAIDQQVASVEPIEPGVQASGRLAVPSVKPQTEPSLVTALVPEQSPVKITASESVVNTQTASAANVAANVPVPQQAVRVVTEQTKPEQSQPIQVASAPAGQAETPLSNQQFKAANLDTRLTGKWALATDASIKDIADIKPPAYGRNILQGSPSSVLARGFSQDQLGKRTSGFGGSSLEFLDFRRFQ